MNSTINIYDGKGDLLLQPLLTQDAVHEEELMKSDFIKLSWDDVSGETLPVDSYIGYGGLHFSLFEPYEPEQKSEAEWHYEPHFQHPKMYLGKVPFTRPSKDSDRNDITLIDWPYTGFVGTLLGYFCDAINSMLGLAEDSAEKFGYEVIGEIPDIVTVTFSTVDILSGLTATANALECEWHIDWDAHILYFGHIVIERNGSTPVLEVGRNIGIPSARDSKDGYWNAIEPQGSTRNITRRAASGEYVQAGVRLSLTGYDNGKYPDGIIYTLGERDADGNIITYNSTDFKEAHPDARIYRKTSIFDDVYPHLDLYAYDIKYRERFLLEDDSNPDSKVIEKYNGDGTPVYKRYAVWYMKLAYPFPTKDNIQEWRDFSIDDVRGIVDITNLIVRDSSQSVRVSFIADVSFNASMFTTPSAASSSSYIVTIEANGAKVKAWVAESNGKCLVSVGQDRNGSDDRRDTAERVNAFAEAVRSATSVTFVEGINRKKFPTVYSQIIDGKSLYCQFKANTAAGAETSPLAGQGDGDNGNYGFGLISLATEGDDYIREANKAPTEDGDTGIVDMDGNRTSVDDNYFEIVFQQKDDYILPTTKALGLIPKGKKGPSLLGNIVNLYNIVMDSSYEETAKGELEEKTMEYIEGLFTDNNSYSFSSNPIAFKEMFDADKASNGDSHLYVGQKVIYKNGDYELPTRVMKVVTKLDYEFEQEITVGNEVLKGAQTQLKEQVQTIIAGSGAGGGGVSESVIVNIVKNWVTPRFLSKQNSDTAQGEIGFLKGLWIKAKGIFGIDGDGNAMVNDVVAGGNGSVSGTMAVGGDTNIGGDLDVAGRESVDRIQSHDYSGSGLADTGYMITSDNGTGSSLAVFDYLTIRKKMIVNSLEIKETHFSAGDVAHTCAAAQIDRTDYLYVDDNGDEELLGYSYVSVPWMLNGKVLSLAPHFLQEGLKTIFARRREVRLTLTEGQLQRCNRIRCYFKSKDGEREIENWFRPNDLVRCQTWNVTQQQRETYMPSTDGVDFNNHAGNVYWWRKVISVSYNTGEPRYIARDADGNATTTTTTDESSAYVNEGGVKRLADNGIYSTDTGDKHAQKEIDGNTYHWFDVAFDYEAERNGQTTNADFGSDIPAAGDKVVQFGNTTDPDRMNIYLVEINGAGNPDSPDWKMYRGVYTFDLDRCWWGGKSCMKTKWSVSTGIEAYAPSFKWITEYGVANQVFTRDEKYWSSIALEPDDGSYTSYPDYSDDVKDANGNFSTRANGKPKNWVRKVRYYEQVSHNGSVWLASFNDGNHWVGADGKRKPRRTEDTDAYIQDYTIQEPSAAANDWTEQVEKGDSGAFKSSVYCRSNTQPSAPSNTVADGYNTYTNPIPPVVSGQPTWTDGIPEGDKSIWESTAWFYSDGTHSDWTTPRRQTDTETLDIEFSPFSSKPSAPSGTAASKDTSSVKTQRHNQGWYDSNDTLPSAWSWSDMVWRAERKIKNGEYYGQWTISRIKGENSVRIDLSNENDTMLYSSSKGLVSGNVLSTASLYDGSTDVSDNAKTSWSVSATGCTVSSGNSRNIVVTEMTAATGYVTVTATYTDKNGTTYVRTTRLTLKKLTDVDKYDLDITPNAIAYNSTKDSPATTTIAIKVWKTVIDGTRALSAPPSGYSVYANGTALTASATGTYSFKTDNSAISEVQVKIATSASSTDALDSETVPVNKAEDGTSIMSANVWYALTQSGTTKPADGDFNLDNFPTTLNSGYYVWEATKVTYSNGPTGFTGKICLGPTTDFLSGEEVYATSQSNSTTPTSWSTSYTRTKGYYLWTATKVTYTNGNVAYLNPKCVGYWGTDGTSPYFADIDNEMDSVACDKDGKTLTDYDVTIGVGLWYGSTPIGITTLDTTTQSGFTITPNKTAKTVRIQVAKGTTIAEVNTINITVAGSGSGSKSLHFVLNGVRQGQNGEPAVLYSLVPSASSVKRDKNNALSPTSLTCDVQRNEGTSVSRATGSQGTLRYRKNGDITSSSDGTALDINTGSVSLTATDTYVVFAFFVDSTLVDKERIPVVYDGQDGQSQQSYVETQEAWSNVESVASTGTEPTPNGGWASSTPANTNGYAYLWRRSRTMTLKTDKSGYNAGEWGNYIRLSGTNGTSIDVKGRVATVSDLPTTHKDGDAYVVDGDNGNGETGHLFMWSEEGNQWIDIGKFQGDSGATYYTHIAWAKDITLGSQSARKTGQTNTPNASGIGMNGSSPYFSIAPQSGYDWMGILVDQDSSDSNDWRFYTWKYAKGADGSTIRSVSIYQWYVPTAQQAAPAKPTSTAIPPTGWSLADSGTHANGALLFMCWGTAVNGVLDSNGWSGPVRMSGKDGDAGADGETYEYIYKQANALNDYGAHPNTINSPAQGSTGQTKADDDFVPNGWADNPQGVSTKMKYEYCSIREKNNGTWGDFSDPFPWAVYGDKGQDGDGVQYVFKRFDHELTDAERTSNTPTRNGITQNANGEWIPTGWSDDPVGTTEQERYEYVATIKRTNNVWGDFETITLWSRYALDGVTHTISINADGYWVIDGVVQNIKAEGKDGTGVDVKGSVQLRSHLTVENGKGYARPYVNEVVGEKTEVSDGHCYVCEENRHLYMYLDSTKEWKDLGEFKGEAGKNSYMHIAYATGVTLSNGIVTAVNGFTVINNGQEYDWWGFCTDNNVNDPGYDATTDAEKLNAAKQYKWNYMKGKDGEGYERIYLFCKEGFKPTINQTAGTGTPSADEFLPNVANYDSTKCKTSGWTDDPEGELSETWPVLWWSERKYNGTSWGTFCAPDIHARYSKDGGTPESRYQWNDNPNQAPSYSANAQDPGANWTTYAPNRPTTAGDHYLWMITAIKNANGTYGQWGNPVRLTGDTGTPGEDGKEREWIYRLDTATGYDSTSDNGGKSYQDDDFVPADWSDNPQGVEKDHPIEYASWRDYDHTTNKWGPFHTPIIWSHWGRNGIDGDGVEYVYIRTKNNVAPVMESTQSEYTDDEFRPTITAASQTASKTEQSQTTDDPTGPDENYPYEWAATRSKSAAGADGTRTWTKFTGKDNDFKMSLWSKYAKDGQRGDFKSRVFTRTNTDISATRPTGGNYDSPWPSPATQNGVTWSDGIPEGTAKIWSSVRTFKADDNTTTWSLPVTESDTADLDIEFSPSPTQPSAPTGNPFTNRESQGWYDPTSANFSTAGTMIWRAERKVKNGAWETGGDWVITRIYGEKGDTGTITKRGETYRYAVSEQNTSHPTLAGDETQDAVLDRWYGTRGKVASIYTQGRFLWTETDIEWSDKSHTILYSDERNPNDGKAGQDIVSGTTTYTYKVTTTNQQPADSEFGPYPSQQADNTWLWCKATTPYYKANDLTTPIGYSSNYSVSYKASNGSNGRSLVQSDEYYKASTLDGTGTNVETAPSDDLGWYRNNPNVGNWNEQNRYLWNYERMEYRESNGTTTVERTEPHIAAIWTKNGKGVDSIVNYYKISDRSSGITSGAVNGQRWTPPAGSGWDDDPIAPTDSEPYLWNFEMVTWLNADGTNDYTYTTPHVVGYKAADGTSVRVVGTAERVIGWNERLPESDAHGKRYLMNNGDTDNMEVYEIEDWNYLVGDWQGYGANIGDCYVVNGHLWECVANEATDSDNPAWIDIGEFKGEPGEDGYTIMADPPTLILEQAGTSNAVSDFGLPKTISFSAKKGNQSVGISSVTATSADINITNSGSTVSVNSMKKGSGDAYISTGIINASVTLSDGALFSVRVPFFANLKAQFKRETLGDIEKAFVDARVYSVNPDGTVKDTKYLYNELNSAQESLTQMRKDATAYNYLPGMNDGTGWSGSTYDKSKWKFTNGSGEVTSPLTRELPAGNYVLSFYSEDYGPMVNIEDGNGNLIWNDSTMPTGEEYQGADRFYMEFTLQVATVIRVNIEASPVYCPLLELGTEPAEFDLADSVTESNIRQTADNINLSVSNLSSNMRSQLDLKAAEASLTTMKNGLESAGVHLDGSNGTIKLKAGKVEFVDPNGNAYATPKVSIDPTDGTLHAVDGEFDGTIRAKILYTQIERVNLNLYREASSPTVRWSAIKADGILPNILVLFSNNDSTGVTTGRKIDFQLPQASTLPQFSFDLYVMKTHKWTSNGTTHYSDEISVSANGGSSTAFQSILGGDGANLYESYTLVQQGSITNNAHYKDRDTYAAGWNPVWHVRLLSDGTRWIVLCADDADIFSW